MGDDDAAKGGSVSERLTRVEERIKALREAVVLAQRNAENALGEAKLSINERLKLLNELRSMVEAWARDFLRADTYEVQHQALIEKMDALAKSMQAEMASLDLRLAAMDNTSRGKAAGVGLIGAIVVGAALVVAALGSMVLALINEFRH